MLVHPIFSLWHSLFQELWYNTCFYLFIPFHYMYFVCSHKVLCFSLMTFLYFPEETELPCSSTQFSRFSGRKCACWFLLRMMTSSQWMMGQVIQNVMNLKRLWIWKLKRNLNLNKIWKIKQLIYFNNKKQVLYGQNVCRY